MLRNLNFKAVYRTDEDNILEDFYIPALSVATKYQRAVGFFSAQMLSFAAQGLSAFLKNNGKMQLIVGGELHSEDEQAITRGYDTRYINEKLGLFFTNTIDLISDALCYRRLEALSWLVATGRLDIKVALRKKGMYHEKIGIISDEDGDAVIFQGSANETAHALLPDYNFESINVFPNWRQELKPHFLPYIEGFEKLWNNNARETYVVDFPEAAKLKLVKISQKCSIPSILNEIDLLENKNDKIGQDNSSSIPKIPELFGGKVFQLKAHQIQALTSWKAKDFRGILALATGSGKTITAIYGVCRLFEATKQLAVIIAVPYQNLADQWIQNLAIFNIQAVRCYGGRSEWSDKLVENCRHYKTGALPFLACVVVNRTLQTDEFQRQIKQLPGNSFLFIGDECHHHSTKLMVNFLPNHSRMRLGLSATPESYLDSIATARLLNFYGDIVYSFSLEDGLKTDVITPYYYHVKDIILSDNEAKSYQELSEKIAVASAGGLDEEDRDNTLLKSLLMKRARLIGNASEKLIVLQNILNNFKPQPFTLFYCGDGSTEGDEIGESIRQVDQVCQILYQKGWKCAKFTSQETRDERDSLLNNFKIGTIDALVAIRCLDEGIDVPACRTAFILASSRNPKQFIQRRGRILRPSIGKEYATIYDFLVKLPKIQGMASQLERNLVKSEIIRIAEFARLAKNSRDAAGVLLPTLKENDLSHLLVF